MKPCQFYFFPALLILFLDSFRNFATCQDENFEDLDKETKELLAWTAPYEIRKMFPLFLSGFDYDGNPVWVIEYGRWDVRSFLENAKPEDIRNYDKYIIQTLTKVHLSPRNFSTPEKPVEEFVVIEDADGFNQRQFSHTPTLNKALFIFREYFRLDQKYGNKLKHAYCINNNFLTTTVWNLAKPLIGPLASRFEILGTNPDKFKAILLRDIPRETLPSWMGGYENHTALEVFG